MPILSMFGTPAFWQDFPDDPPAQSQMDATWSPRAEGWIQQAILGNPWNQTYSANQTFFYDPSTWTFLSGRQPRRSPELRFLVASILLKSKHSNTVQVQRGKSAPTR